MVSRKVGAAYARRASRKGKSEANIEWFIDDIQQLTDKTLEERMETAMQYLWVKTVKNINVPVVKELVTIKRGPNKGKTLTRVTKRSNPGEFPRADTTNLRESIASEVVRTDKGFEGYIITPLDYAVILELRLDRRFLRRTLEEEIPQLERILGAKLKA